MQTHSSALAATASATEPDPTPLAAATPKAASPCRSPSSTSLPRSSVTLPLKNVSALQRFIAEASLNSPPWRPWCRPAWRCATPIEARAQLLAKGQDTGTTHILDGEFDITVEIGKDVKWEPKGLTELVGKIEATGGDPRAVRGDQVQRQRGQVQGVAADPACAL